MAGAVATVEGLDKLQRMLKNAPKATRKLLTAMIKESVTAVAADARRIVHKREGDLANAIRVFGQGISWRAGVEDENVPSRRRGPSAGRGRGNTAHMNPYVYGRWEERGTSRTNAHPFMRPAAEAEATRLPGRLRELAARLPDESKG